MSGAAQRASAGAGAARAGGMRLVAVGLALVAAAWPLNWGLCGLRTHLLFFPLWLGYVLAVQGLTWLRSGTCAWARSRAGFALQFAVSAPLWWLFEMLNLRLRNWEYVGREHFSDLAYFALCTVAFSTVVPAVLSTAELMRSFRFVERFARGPVVRPTRSLCIGLFAAGVAMCAAMLARPAWFYPFAWVSGVFLLEPVCVAARRRGILADLARGDWRTWVALWSGVLVCGLFWEMWNWYSYPKWVYHVPGVDFGRVFEMPILGYLGYLPFSMEVYLIHQLVVGGDRPWTSASRSDAGAHGSPDTGRQAPGPRSSGPRRGRLGPRSSFGRCVEG